MELVAIQLYIYSAYVLQKYKQEIEAESWCKIWMWLCSHFLAKLACSFSPRVLIPGTGFGETIYHISLGLQCLALGFLKPTLLIILWRILCCK